MAFEIVFILRSRKSTLKPLAELAGTPLVAWVWPRVPNGLVVCKANSAPLREQPDWGDGRAPAQQCSPADTHRAAPEPHSCRLGRRLRVRGWERTKMPLRTLLCLPTCHCAGARSLQMCWKVSHRPRSTSRLRSGRWGRQSGLLWAVFLGWSVSGYVMVSWLTLQCRVCEQLWQNQSTSPGARPLGPPFITQSWQGPLSRACPAEPPALVHRLSDIILK